MNRLPDGSGFMIGEFPLPKDHWLLRDGDNRVPMRLRVGINSPYRKQLEWVFRAAVRYGLRVSTMNGKEALDPDALVQNVIVGALGVATPDGTGEEFQNPEMATIGLQFCNFCHKMLCPGCGDCDGHLENCPVMLDGK
ncbi:MAG: hypothetical protein KGL39_45820 [Patescibacteria group bacterium]|nr:hypothetical protein [Patescibacteria group bacterium]